MRAPVPRLERRTHGVVCTPPLRMNPSVVHCTGHQVSPQQFRPNGPFSYQSLHQRRPGNGRDGPSFQRWDIRNLPYSGCVRCRCCVHRVRVGRGLSGRESYRSGEASLWRDRPRGTSCDARRWVSGGLLSQSALALFFLAGQEASGRGGCWSDGRGTSDGRLSDDGGGRYLRRPCGPAGGAPASPARGSGRCGSCDEVQVQSCCIQRKLESHDRILWRAGGGAEVDRGKTWANI